MAPAPKPVTIPRLVHHDAVDPRPQTRVSAKTMDGTEDPEEDLLRQVERLFPVAQKIRRQLKNGPLMFGHQLRRRVLIARGAALHERRLAIADVRPVDDARLLHPEFPNAGVAKSG